MAALRLQKVVLPEHSRLGREMPITPLIDRGDGTIIIPGLKDHHAHSHLTAIFIEGAKSVDVSGCKTLPELQAELRKHTDRKLIVATGWDTTAIPKLTHRDVDEISTDVPILVFDPSFHGGVLNTRAAQHIEEAVRPYRETINGTLDENGHWTEQFLYPCMGLIAETMGEEQFTKAIFRWAVRELRRGVVEMEELDIGDLFSLRCLVNAYEVWQSEMPSDAPFPVPRVYGIPPVLAGLKDDSRLRGKVESYWGGMGMKLYADGAIGSHTACLERPYVDREGNGALVDTPEHLQRILRMLSGVDIPAIAIHAIGDKGIDMSLEMARMIRPLRRIACRIEHYEISGSPYLLTYTKRARDAGLVSGVSIQSPFNTDVANYRPRLGERAGQINPLASILQYEIPVNLGVDDLCSGYPVPGMLSAISHAVNHPVEAQRVPLDVALRIAATWDFFFSGQELDTRSVVVLDAAFLEKVRSGVVDTTVLDPLVRRVVYHGYDVHELLGDLGV